MDDEAKRNLQIVEGDFLSALNDIRKLRGQAPLSALPEPPFCSFCGQSKDEVRALIVSAILGKLGVSDRTQAALIALRHGLERE